MIKRTLTATLFTALVAISSVSHAALPFFNNDNNEETPTIAPMLSQVTPAVVNIAAAGTKVEKQAVPDAFRYFFGPNAPRNQVRERPFRSVGSGVIIDAEKGYVVTNHHVIDEADEIVITLKDGRQIDAKKLGSDADSDIALLQIDADNLTDVPLANSDKSRVGDFVVAIGNPFGLGQTVTSGIVSALGRSGLDIEKYENFIQTDAAINSGNSGGALVDLKGRLVGINTAILGPNGGNVGIGFAIPVNMMKSLVTQIAEFGQVKRGVLGVRGQNLDADLAEAMELSSNKGAFIVEVYPDTAAAQAGLKNGDVITSVNGAQVNSFNELRAKIGTLGAGASVKLGVIRDGNKKSITVELGEQQQTNIAAATLHPALEGANLGNGETQTGQAGVLVKSVAKRSPAHQTGLEEEDIIIGINRQRIENVGQLREILKDKKGVVALNVVRGQTSLYLVIR